MLSWVYNCYRVVFGKKSFQLFNKLLYNLSLRGLGVLNYENDTISGERTFLKIISQKVDTIFDIGAHIGDYSKAIKDLDYNIAVYSFEPHPTTFKKLMEASRRFNFKAFNFGFGKESGKITLYDYENSDGSSHASLYREVIEKMRKGSVIAHEIEIRTLDSFVNEYAIDGIDLLKIDAEGHEYDILLGAKNLLADHKIKVIHFEFNEMNVVSRTFFKDFSELLYNFQLFRMLRHSLLPLDEYTPVYCEIFAYQNIVAIHKRHLHEFNY